MAATAFGTPGGGFVSAPGRGSVMVVTQPGGGRTLRGKGRRRKPLQNTIFISRLGARYAPEQARGAGLSWGEFLSGPSLEWHSFEMPEFVRASAMDPLVIYVGNDTPFQGTGLRDALGGMAQSNKTVTAQLKDESGVNVGSAVTATPGSESGSYYGVLPYSLSLTAGNRYVLHVDCNAGTNLVGHWEFPVQALTRKG